MPVIKRSEAKEIDEYKGWIILYGRRKVGKTFLLKNFVSWDYFYTVTRGLKVVKEERNSRKYTVMNTDAAIKDIVFSLKSGYKTIVDEFQRLPEHSWDILATAHPDGKLILSGSSRRVVEKILGARSPLLGLLAPYRLDLIKPCDAVVSLVKTGLSPEKAIEWAVILRDPWVIPHLDIRKDPSYELAQKIHFLVGAVIGLIGEVFTEEERRMTRLYEAIIRRIASGNWKLSELANSLFSLNLIEKGIPSQVTPYLDRLVKMGIIERIKTFKSRWKTIYKVRSPIMSILLKIDEEDFIYENIQYNAEKIEEKIRSILGIELQFFIGELLSQTEKKKPLYQPHDEIDIILSNKRKTVIEVKRRPVTQADIQHLREKAAKIGIWDIAIVTLRGEKTSEKIITPYKLVEKCLNQTIQ